MARHDAHHRLAGADQAGAVRPDQAGAPVFCIAPQISLDGHHVLSGDAVGDGDDQPDTRVGGFHDRVSAERCRHEDEARGRCRVRYRFLHRVEDGSVEVRDATFARRDAAHDVGAVGDHLLRVERSLVAGEALDDDARLLVEQDAHAAAPAWRAATTRSAASASVAAVTIDRPLSCRMRRPSFTFVPATPAD